MTPTTRSLSPEVIPILIKALNVKVLSPAFRAFLFAYLYVTIPKSFFAILRLVKKHRVNEIPATVLSTFKSGCKPYKFPALAAKLMLQINITEPIIYWTLKFLPFVSKRRRRLFLSTLIASFSAAVIHFRGFQNRSHEYGRQIALDLTLLVATRAFDTIVSFAFLGTGTRKWDFIGDGALFVTSSALIMYSWFYHPERLPPAYRNWITSAASMDNELVSLLRDVKNKQIVYGERGPGEVVLKSYCERMNQSPEKGSLFLNKPLSCECIHAFVTSNCELHALWRFCRGFLFSIKLYGSINLLMLLLSGRKGISLKKFFRHLVSSMRSSAFLGSFIALCWYGVCLGRNRLLPRLFPNVPKTRWDDTIAVMFGCVLSGFSCFVEKPQRRKELALFVTPRAVGTLVSTPTTERQLWLERLTFAVSMAILVAFVKEDPTSVRGLFGKGLQSVLSA